MGELVRRLARVATGAWARLSRRETIEWTRADGYGMSIWAPDTAIWDTGYDDHSGANFVTYQIGYDEGQKVAFLHGERGEFDLEEVFSSALNSHAGHVERHVRFRHEGYPALDIWRRPGEDGVAALVRVVVAERRYCVLQGRWRSRFSKAVVEQMFASLRMDDAESANEWLQRPSADD